MSDLTYLSEKRTALSNPGTKLDDIYYSQLNSLVELSEVTYNFGRYFANLNSLQFGGQSQVNIPNSELLEGVYLYIEAPPLVANQTLPLGWGFAMLSSISYLFGSSNVSQLDIRKHSIFQTIMYECETQEKRDAIFRLAGEETIGPTDDTVKAYLKLPFPFSSVCGIHSKKPFDTSLLTNPIILQIAFDQSAAVYGGSGVQPTSLVKAGIYIRQGVFKNKDQSLKPAMMANPNLMYTYPFIHRQLFTTGSFTGSRSSSAPVTMTLTGLINADLVGLTIGVVKNSQIANDGTKCPCPFVYDEIQNVLLQFNGLQMFNSPGKFYKFLNMIGTAGSGAVQTSLIANSATAPFSSSPQMTYPIYIDFGRIRSACFDGHYSNTWRIGNNTLTLSFNTSTTETYTMYVTYHYNGVCEVQSGQARIYFD